MKTITYNPETHVLVPREPSEEMLCKATKVDLGKDCDEKGICINLYQAMIAAAPQPEPVESEPVAMVDHHCEGGINWYNGNDIKIKCGTALYTTPQPDRTAELEAALKVARDAAKKAIEMIETNAYERRHVRWELIDAIDKINEVLKP